MDPLVVTLVVAALVVAAAVAIIWSKGRPIAGGDVFRASRLSEGNFWFPTQVRITPTSVVHVTPQLVGRQEHSIHMAHVASVSVHTHLLFSDVLIETTGGTSTGALPRPPQAGRPADEAAHRGVPDGLLPVAGRHAGPPAGQSSAVVRAPAQVGPGA